MHATGECNNSRPIGYGYLPYLPQCLVYHWHIIIEKPNKWAMRIIGRWSIGVVLVWTENFQILLMSIMCHATNLMIFLHPKSKYMATNTSKSSQVSIFANKIVTLASMANHQLLGHQLHWNRTLVWATICLYGAHTQWILSRYLWIDQFICC